MVENEFGFSLHTSLTVIFKTEYNVTEYMEINFSLVRIVDLIFYIILRFIKI